MGEYNMKKNKIGEYILGIGFAILVISQVVRLSLDYDMTKLSVVAIILMFIGVVTKGSIKSTKNNKR